MTKTAFPAAWRMNCSWAGQRQRIYVHDGRGDEDELGDSEDVEKEGNRKAIKEVESTEEFCQGR